MPIFLQLKPGRGAPFDSSMILSIHFKTLHMKTIPKIIFLWVLISLMKPRIIELYTSTNREYNSVFQTHSTHPVHVCKLRRNQLGILHSKHFHANFPVLNGALHRIVQDCLRCSRINVKKQKRAECLLSLLYLLF